MARIRLISCAVLALFCLGVMASTAFGDEGLEFVNKEGSGHKLVKNKFSSTSGEAVLEGAGGATTKCKISTDHGVITSTTGGEVTVLFKECSSAGHSCKGGEDAAGAAKAGEIIVLLGILTTPSNKGTERLLLLTVFKTKTLEAGEFTYECSGLPIIVRGSILTTNNYKTNALSKTYKLEFTSKGAKTGEQAVTESENSKGEKIKCKGLEANITGAFEKASETVIDNVTLEEEGQFI
jgi:hypothetical protein